MWSNTLSLILVAEDLGIYTFLLQKQNRTCDRQEIVARVENCPGTQWRPWTNKHTTRCIRLSRGFEKHRLSLSKCIPDPRFAPEPNGVRAPPSAGETAIASLRFQSLDASRPTSRNRPYDDTPETHPSICAFIPAHIPIKFGTALPFRGGKIERRRVAERRIGAIHTRYSK